MNRQDSTFAGVLAAVRTQLTAIGGVPFTSVRLAKRPVADLAKLPQTSPLFVVCPSSEWTRNDGIGMVGDSEMILDGQIIVQTLVRQDIDEPEMSESLLTDRVLGNDGPIDTVLRSLDENPCADASGYSPLMEPLYVAGVSIGQTVDDTRWQEVRLSFACKFRYRGGSTLNVAVIQINSPA